MAQFKEISPNAPAGEKLLNWVDNRFPLSKLYKDHLSEYYASKNLNIWYVFGALSLLVLVIQIVTGIFLVMHYKPDAALAFASVEYIMRDVPWGWLIRYMHSTGASAFFVVVYLHMFRGLMYGSYRKPRELVWIFGCGIFLVLMAEAFMGYLLPWGQMSYWGAQVIVNLFHVIAVPLVLLGLVVAHIIALHEVGSNNPDGVEIKAADAPKDAKGNPLDGIPFHPYYTVHDIFSVSVFLMAFTAIVFFAPEFGGYFLEYNNFIPADPLTTPLHIAPVWYFTPYYSMLRAITTEMMYVLVLCVVVGAFLAVAKGKLPTLLKGGLVGASIVICVLLLSIDAKFWGVVVMGGAVIIMFFLPWLDYSPAKSIRYRPDWHKYVYAVFVINFLILGYLGVKPPSPIGERVSQVGTLFYFGFFLLMPWWSKLGTFKQVPDRVTFTPH